MRKPYIFRVYWEQKHATKKLSENATQPEIEPGSPDNMLGALNHSAIESSTLATWRPYISG